jgi:hypothetical protein
VHLDSLEGRLARLPEPLRLAIAASCVRRVCDLTAGIAGVEDAAWRAVWDAIGWPSIAASTSDRSA